MTTETLERRVRAEVLRAGVPREVIEKDYAIGYVLAGMYGLPALGRRLVFKGGTALRKAYFPDYRLSEDLDFTALPGSDDLEPLIKEAAARAEKALQGQGDFGISVTRYPTREPRLDWREGLRRMVADPPELDVCLRDLRPPVSALVKRALSPAG